MRPFIAGILIIVSILFIAWALSLTGCATNQPCALDDQVCNQQRAAQAMLQTGAYLTPPPTRF